MLSLDKLTPQQEEKLRECTGSYVHVKAPAGAGKTFVALSHMLDTLLTNREALDIIHMVGHDTG